MRNVFGVKLKLVTGYHGTSDIILAIERGEVDGRCGWSWSSVKSTRPAWIPEKKLNYLVHISDTKAPELPHVPLLNDFANERQKQILRLVTSRQIMGRPFAAPPGVPADREQALRRAFDATLKDPAFLAEAEKLKLEVNPVTGEEIDRLIAELYTHAEGHRRGSAQGDQAVGSLVSRPSIASSRDLANDNATSQFCAGSTVAFRSPTLAHLPGTTGVSVSPATTP